jgi:hypothetical protein
MTSTPASFPFQRVGHATPALESRVSELVGPLALIPPNLLADRTGVSYLELGPTRGEFHLALLDAPLLLTYPDFRALAIPGDALPAIERALLLYYFLTADGTPPTDTWVSFADLPDGRVYSSAFQGYTGNELAKAFALDLDSFRLACERLAGQPLSYGSASYRFRALPRLDLALVYHLGDEDFPSTCNLLFDSNASHYLPAEACAILGSMLAQKILRARN